MRQSTVHRRRHRQAGVSQLVAIGGRGLWRLASAPAPALSQRAKARLVMLEWHAAHGRNVSLTARHHGYSRPTVYRWLARYDPHHLATLEDRSSAPHRRRRRTWSLAQIEAVRELRERYPRWSKTKIAVVLRRDRGLVISASMVGRILTYLRRRGQLREPMVRRISARKRRPTRPHATRKPPEYRVERPGDLVGLDTLDVRPPGVTHPYKRFTARDQVSRS